MRQIVAIFCTTVFLIAAVSGADRVSLGVARFTSADELIFPADTERWIVLGANIGGDYSDAEFNPKNPGMIGVVQMEPNAYNYLLEHKE